MLTKQSTITMYYSMITLTLGVIMIYTLYQSSRAVSYGQRISELEAKKQALLTQRAKLEHELAEAKSLLQLKNADHLNAYQPITNPLTLPTLKTTAIQE